MAEENFKIELLAEQVKDLKEENKDFEKRLTELETKKEKTDFQYEQIMEEIKKLNEKTIPKVLEEIEKIKNKPAKKWETITNTLITTIVAAVVSFVVTKIGG